MSDNKWFMAGSEGSGKYVVVAMSPKGRLGFRDFGNQGVRVRFEPKTQEASLEVRDHFGALGWNRPEGSSAEGFRYSTMADEAWSKKAVSDGLAALGLKVNIETNPSAPDWAKELLDNPVDHKTVKSLFMDDTPSPTEESEPEDEDSPATDDDDVEQAFKPVIDGVDRLVMAAESLADAIRKLRDTIISKQ